MKELRGHDCAGSIAHIRKTCRHGLRPLLACVIAFSFPGAALSQAPTPQIVNITYVVGRGPSPKIVNGLLTAWYPNVGAVLYRLNNRGFISWCTATLIGCNTVLTAAHCIANDSDVRNYKVYFQHGGIFDVASIAWRPNEYEQPNASTGAKADISVLKLARPVNGIAPQPINEDREHAPDLKGTIIGFGRTGGEADDYGLKRFGEVTAAACSRGFHRSELVCWNFKGQQESNTCNGDSGGPLLLSEGRPREVLSGVTSGGINRTCLSTDHSFDTSVFQHRTWIRSATGSDLGQAACGRQVALEEKRERYRAFGGQINDAAPTHVLEVEVKGVQELRVAANLGKPLRMDQAEPMALSQLSVISGRNRDTSKALCVSKLDAPAAFCAADNPADGVYTIVLGRAGEKGRADFQLVVSVF